MESVEAVTAGETQCRLAVALSPASMVSSGIKIMSSLPYHQLKFSLGYLPFPLLPSSLASDTLHIFFI
jgi:hypothetical protein